MPRRSAAPSRCLPLLFASLLAGAAVPALSTAARADGIAFVLNSADASVSEFDIDTHKEIRRVPVLREPHHMALTPDGHSLIVGDTAGNAAFFFDPRTGLLQKREPMADPYQLQFSPNGQYLTIAGLARDQVDILDPRTLALLHRVHAASMPSHMNYSPDSSVVYVSLQETGRVMAIDTKTGTVLWNMPVGSTPAGVLWHEGKLLVGDMGERFVAVLDPTDGHLVRKLDMAPGPHNLFAEPSRHELFVTCRVSGVIEQLDWNTLDPIRSWRIPGGPDDIVFGPNNTLWATLRWRQKVAILDTNTGQVSFIPTGRSPHGIWLNTAVPASFLAAGANAP